MEAKPYKIPHPFRKLNKKLIDKIVKDIDEGSTHKLACESNGITEAIFSIWRKQGRVDFDFEVESLPAYLVKSLANVKQKEIKWSRNVIKESEKGHKGAEWTLEHAHQKDFSTNAAIRELAEEIEEVKSWIKKGDFKNGEQMDTKDGHEEGRYS